MRTTLKHTLAALAALGALMLTGTACTQDDPLGGNPTPGTQLLQLGKVTIAGAETATRSTDAATRADADGFIGIRKTQFVKNDKLVLTLKDNQGATIGSTITATLSEDGTTWTLDPVKTYFTPGTTVSAKHTPTQMSTNGSSGLTTRDVLVTAQPEPLNTNGTPLALTLTHANAMVEVTPPTGITYKDLTIYATRSGAPDAQALSHFTEGTGTNLRHRTIAPVGATLNSISLKMNGITYTTTIDPQVVVEANKRYPITLTITGDKLEATVAAGTNWGVGGDVDGLPTTYKYYISTPADLVKFRDDVNRKTATTATAIQTADIDMSGIAWEPIGNGTALSFQGSYNGNGYSISNLKIDDTYTNAIHYLGLFGVIEGAKITGIHLRDCNLKGSGGSNIYAGALAAYAVGGNIITLCSTTGKIEATADNVRAAGLVGYNPTSTGLNHYTRCNVDVDVTTTSKDFHYTCAFTGYSANVTAAGCIASGTVTANATTGLYSGFGYTNGKADPYRTIGCITNSEVTNDVKIGFGQINSILSCLATQPSYNSFCREATTVTDNVSLGTHTSTTVPNPAGVSIGVKAADAYGLLTANNVASPIKIKTLHYSPTDGYTTDVVEQYWYAYGIWQKNGTNLPTIDMSYEGNPEPIQPGNNVYAVNGYWVTAPESETTGYVWTINNNHQPTMTPDPCAAGANKGWKMPTITDFQAMLGWTGTHNWEQSLANNLYHNIADATNFTKAFPAGNRYWSSTHNSTSGLTTNAWCLQVDATGSTGAYNCIGKSNECPIRCVQEIAP